MENKTVWVRAPLSHGSPSCYFPGNNLFQAQDKARMFLESLSIPMNEVEIEEYTPRKKTITDRKRKRLHARRVLTGH